MVYYFPITWKDIISTLKNIGRLFTTPVVTSQVCVWCGTFTPVRDGIEIHPSVIRINWS